MKHFRLFLAILLTFALVSAGFATVNRQVPTPSSDPGGISGADYASDVAEEAEALWRVASEPLTSVSGTNTITASTAVSSLAAYETGNRFSFIAAATNTGAVTINIDGRGAKAVTDAGGGALAAGALASGSLYGIEYDGTGFRLLGAGGIDLGAEIANATNKATPVDADVFPIADSAASNALKKVSLANLRSALGGGMELFDEDEPTSDVSAITKTGMSVYRDVTISFAAQYNTGGGNFTIDARASGGTWRTLMSVSYAAVGQGLMIGELTIRNFGRNNNIKLYSGSYYGGTGAGSNIDRSDAITYNADTKALAGIATYTEQWDEVRIAVSTQTIEGSTADQRAYVAYYGEGDGD